MPDQQRRPQEAAPEQDTSLFDGVGAAVGSAAGAMAGPAGMLGMQGLMGNSAVNAMIAGGAGGADQAPAGGLMGSIGSWVGDKVNSAANWVSNTASTASSWVGDKVNSAANWASGAADTAGAWINNKVDGVKQVASDFGNGVSQEGLGGLLDPAGMMDRQAAQRELADRFSVVPNDFVGPRLPNQVTQSEYQDLCRNYSDIRMGRGDLTIDPSALTNKADQDAYRTGAMGDIANLLQTQSGRAMIAQLHDNHPQNDASGNPLHRHTTMVPLLKADGTRDLTNGYAAPDGAGSRRTLNADGTAGAAGTGTDVHIRYNPGVNIGDAYPTLTGPNPWLGDFRSDVLLMHEMNHAMNQTAGTGDPVSVSATDNPSNATDPEMAWDAGNGIGRIEHQAAGLGTHAGDPLTENRYRAERALMGATGSPGLRAGDSTMHQRTSYVPHNPPAAVAPGGTPGLPAFVHHGDHDDD